MVNSKEMRWVDEVSMRNAEDIWGSMHVLTKTDTEKSLASHFLRNPLLDNAVRMKW